jgi:hypothetical protein
MKKVLVIHGGNTYDSHEEYVEYLKNKEVDLEKIRSSQGWKNSLEQTLGGEFEVYLPKMPLSDNAEYVLWELWYKKVTEALGFPKIVIGHSLGAMFLAKYYSENLSKEQLKALFFVAPMYCGEGQTDYNCRSFSLEEDLHILHKNAKNIHFFFSEDDVVVPYSNCAFFQKQLPEAAFSHFKDRGHFNEEDFPELVDEIKKLA